MKKIYDDQKMIIIDSTDYDRAWYIYIFYDKNVYYGNYFNLLIVDDYLKKEAEIIVQYEGLSSGFIQNNFLNNKKLIINKIYEYKNNFDKDIIYEFEKRWITFYESLCINFSPKNDMVVNFKKFIDMEILALKALANID